MGSNNKKFKEENQQTTLN